MRTARAFVALPPFTLLLVSLLAVTLYAVTLHATEVKPPVEPQPEKKPIVESRVNLPKADADGKLVRVIDQGKHRLKLDLADQILRLDAPKEESWRTAKEAIRAGDTVVVTAASTPLQLGNKTLGKLSKGQLIAVLKVEGDHLATSIVAGGQQQNGWVKIADVKFHAEEPVLSATLAKFAGGETVSAALLAQKAKQFDDGLYAAVDLAAQQGAGEFAGKVALLTRLAGSFANEKLTAQKLSADDPRLVLLAAAELGGVKGKELPAALRSKVTAVVKEFQGDALKSKPIGFYTWSPDLKQIFQQDRMLQTLLSPSNGLEAIATTLYADDASKETYEQYLELISKLTNPLKGDDLRPQHYSATVEGDQAGAAHAIGLRFFPASRSHEADLIMRLYGNSEIPEGFNLMDELIKRIQSGEIDLAPTENSGWYDYQTWSLEPLANPEKTPEAAHLKMADNYQKLLIELFKGALALARETHIKQLENPRPASEAGGREREPRLEFFVSPELTVEPLATAYQRRAISYRFIRGVLEATFGPEALTKMHRQTAAGPVELTLADELNQMENLFHGAAVTANRQLGMTRAEEAPQAGGDADVDAAAFLKWAANLTHDADLGADARMMVPVFYDLQRKKTKVWAVLGWTDRQVYASYEKPPVAHVFDKDGTEVPKEKYDLHYWGNSQRLAYPVMAEVYVSEILDRDQFRRHCDIYQTQAAILSNLK